MIKGGMNTAALASRPHGVQVNSSVYGKAVKLVYGMTQVGPDLIWYNDWQVHGSPSNPALESLFQAGGKKSGKASKKGDVHYYSAAVDLLFGHAPILGVMSIWFNNLKLIVKILSASGFISGGSFAFNVSSDSSKVDYYANVPASPPYTIQVPDFVAGKNVKDENMSVNGSQMLIQIAEPGPPGQFEYMVNDTGLYTFNVAQATNQMRITYYKTTSASGGILAGIIAVTVHENYSASFNDYGGPGTVNVFGTWERPLWNANYAVPGRIDAGAFHARDPYTWEWDGSSPSITVPSDLEGFPCTVYYGTPLILKTDGTFYSNTITPIQLLNLEFERQLASGTEYTKFPAQQLIQAWVSGAGSPKFDLGIANTMPNMNFETLGAFVLWPNGDCDVADAITDICYSGPVLV